MVNLSKLRLSDGPGFPRLWNRLVDELQRGTIVSVAPPLMLSGDLSGQRLGIIMPSSGETGGDVKFGAVQTDFTSGTQISVKACDGNGVTSGDAFDVYVYAGQGSADLTAVTVAGASATATCKLAQGKIIAYSYSGADAYLVGDVMQIVHDVRYNTTSHKLQAKFYWRVGIAVSTISDWADISGISSIQFGKVVSDFTTGATVTVSPCAPDGTTNGAANVSVYLQWSKASVDLTKDADGSTIDAKLAANTVIAYITAADGNRYGITNPACIVTKIDYSSDGIRTYHRWVVAGAQTTEGTTPVDRIPFYDAEVHQVRWNDTDKKLEVRTATIRVPVPATWGDWESILDYECLSPDTINSLTGSTGGGSYT